MQEQIQKDKNFKPGTFAETFVIWMLTLGGIATALLHFCPAKTYIFGPVCIFHISLCCQLQSDGRWGQGVNINVWKIQRKLVSFHYKYMSYYCVGSLHHWFLSFFIVILTPYLNFLQHFILPLITDGGSKLLNWLDFLKWCIQLSRTFCIWYVVL